MMSRMMALYSFSVAAHRAVLAVAHHVDREPVRGQPVTQRLGQAALVLDHQNPHRAILAEPA